LSAFLVPIFEPSVSPPRAVTGVHLAEEVSAISRGDAGSIVILSARASAEATGYRLDVAVRLAGDSEAAALVLVATDSIHIDSSARGTAEAGGVRLLRAEPDISIAVLIAELDSRLSDGGIAGLERAHEALVELVRLRDEDASVDELLAAASDCLGQPVHRGGGTPDDLTTGLIIDERVEGFLRTGRPERRSDQLAAELVLGICASAVGAEMERARGVEEAPERRRAELLTEVLTTPARRAEQLVDRARALGVDIDGWHTAILLDPGEEVAGLPERVRFDRLRELRRDALEVAREAGGVWQRARSGEALLFVRVDPADPDPTVMATVIKVAEQVVDRSAARIKVRAGIGSSHAGAAGLRRSVAEARTALAGHENPVSAFDSLGANRFVAEWSASPIGEEIGETLLSPLRQLGPERFDEWVRTLSAYLDHRGSLLHAAKQLHLHRNSLAYRIKRILELLEVDLEDPDQWLLLQLACRSAVLQLDRVVN
jgi:sugar diacid utilization regulator